MAFRSIARVSGTGDALETALESAADAVALSLTDERQDAQAARVAVSKALGRIVEKEKHAFAIVNHPRTQLLRADLEAVVSKHLTGVMVADTTEPQDVRDTAVLLREFELQRDMEPGTVSVFPVIGSARGLLRAAEIAAAASRVAGLVFASDRYARDVGARAEEHGERLAYARGAVVAAARAADGLPLHMGNAVDVRTMSQYGFAAAILSDAELIAAANAAFEATEAEVRHAEAHVAAYDAARAEGAWVGRHEGVVVDAHRARKARLVLEHQD
jgi:citrate lyase subunit beta / citryl-CoA lyase